MYMTLLDIDTPSLAECCMVTLYVVNFILPWVKKPPDILWSCWQLTCRVIWALVLFSFDPPTTFWLIHRIAPIVPATFWYYLLARTTVLYSSVKRELRSIFTNCLLDWLIVVNDDMKKYSTLLDSPCGDNCICQDDTGPLPSFTIDETMLDDDWFCQSIGTKPSAHVHGLMMQSPMPTKPKLYASQKQAD
jgi:hypothetical protein